MWSLGLSCKSIALAHFAPGDRRRTADGSPTWVRFLGEVSRERVELTEATAELQEQFELLTPRQEHRFVRDNPDVVTS